MSEVLRMLVISIAPGLSVALVADQGSALLIAAGLTAVIAIAAFAIVHVVLGSSLEDSASRSAPGSRLGEPLVLSQSDPDAPGRARPRAPGAASAA